MRDQAKRRCPDRVALGLVVFLVASSSGTSAQPEQLCRLDQSTMPSTWRPGGKVQKGLSAAPWTAAEAKIAVGAVETALAELTGFLAKKPGSIEKLKIDAVEPFVDASYSASNMPGIQAAARNEARRVLSQLLLPYLRRNPVAATCSEFGYLLPYTVYAHSLFATQDPRLSAMVNLTNLAYRECGSLQAVIGKDPAEILSGSNASVDDLYSLVMWSITFGEAHLVPGIALPAETRSLAPTLWRYLANYQFKGARDFPAGAWDESFQSVAYLATHIAYIPTGYGRYPIRVSDAPHLYRYLRENFYPVLEMGELDLVAEFVDLFRQYGCTEDNDLQVRDGTRHLLNLFQAAGGSWIAHREPSESSEISDYAAIHKPWTAMAGVRVRVPELPAPGNYGGIVRGWLDARR